MFLVKFMSMNIALNTIVCVLELVDNGLVGCLELLVVCGWWYLVGEFDGFELNILDNDPGEVVVVVALVPVYVVRALFLFFRYKSCICWVALIDLK
jgi:hypothetical protein